MHVTIRQRVQFSEKIVFKKHKQLQTTKRELYMYTVVQKRDTEFFSATLVFVLRFLYVSYLLKQELTLYKGL